MDATTLGLWIIGLVKSTLVLITCMSLMHWAIALVMWFVIDYILGHALIRLVGSETLEHTAERVGLAVLDGVAATRNALGRVRGLFAR